MKFSIVALALTSTASALCHNSISCILGGDSTCNNVCVREGNPNGGRCLPRDGCPGYTICACYPRKRGGDQIDGEQKIWEDEVKPALAAFTSEEELAKPEVYKNVMEAAIKGIVETGDVQARATLDARSICCSLLPPFSGLCCENHCSYIGKPGGQCKDLGNGEVCSCN